jgi:Na+-driven multidrug efflux pump
VSTVTVAAYGIGTTVVQVVMIPAMGLSMAVATLVGQNIGAGQVDRAERIARLGVLMGFGVLTLVGAVAFVSARAIVTFFVPSDPAVIAAGTEYLRIMALSWGFLGAQFSMTGVLRASGNMMTTMMLTLVSQWVLQFPLAYMFSMHTSLRARGIWWAFPVSNAAIAVITAIVFASGEWKHKRLVSAEEALTVRVTDEIIAEEPK